MLKHLYGIFLASILSVSLFTGHCLANKDDGFGLSRKIESRYFTIYYALQLDPDELARELGMRALDTIISGGPYQDDLGGLIDALFSQACDILDMQLYSFHGNIKISRDFNQLKTVYDNLFGKQLSKNYSFYSYDLNTVYISSEHFNREVLGHEIAHAIISHYFAVSPSVKIQEVLATFVAFHLRKTSNK